MVAWIRGKHARVVVIVLAYIILWVTLEDHLLGLLE